MTAATQPSFDHTGLLLCPVCKFDATHVEVALVSARTEDVDANEIKVDATNGQVQTHRAVSAPTGPTQGVGRRHRIALEGTCEEGHSFAIVFTQHKGGTFVEAVPLERPTD
jgi:uncharacterized Zn finger protein (UPF0148 family)